MQMICRGSKLWQKSTCNVITFHKHIQVCSLGENSMTGRAYMGELLNQVWLELLDKQVNAQKEKILQGSRKPTKKCEMKMRVEEKMTRT